MSKWTDFNAWMERNERASFVVVVFAILAVILFLLSGCGTSSDRQTNTVEKEKFVTPPMTIDTPFGQFVVQPGTFYKQREIVETEHTDKHLVAPEAGAIIGAVAGGGTPWGTIISGVVGLGVAAFAGKKAVEVKTVKRQFNEVVDSVEAGSENMTDEEWKAFSAKFKQSKDTREAIRAHIA